MTSAAWARRGRESELAATTAADVARKALRPRAGRGERPVPKDVSIVVSPAVDPADFGDAKPRLPVTTLGRQVAVR